MLPQLFANGVVAASLYVLVALGFGLIYNTGRFFHFALGTTMTCAAYLAWAVLAWSGGGLWLAIPVGVVGAALLGALMEWLVYRPLRRRGSPSLVLLLASLGLTIALQNGISMLFGDVTRGLRSGAVAQGIALAGAHVTPVQLSAVATAAVLLVSLALLMMRTDLGLAIRAVAQDPELAQVSGIDSDRVFTASFAVGSALAGVAGVLMALDVGLTPSMGMRPLMLAVVAIVVGGIGSLPGAAVGAVILGLGQQLSVLVVGSAWQDTFAFVLLLVFLLLRPRGLMGPGARALRV